MKGLIVMFAHPAVWIEDENKRVICEFPSATPEDDFEARKKLAHDFRAGYLLKQDHDAHWAQQAEIARKGGHLPGSDF